MRSSAEWLVLLHGGETDEATEKFDALVINSIPRAKANLIEKGVSDDPLEMLTATQLMADVFVAANNQLMAFSAICDMCALIEIAQQQGWNDETIEFALLQSSSDEPQM